MQLLNNKTKYISYSAIISALYIVLSFIAFPLASSNIQIRLGEMLTLFPIFLSEANAGLFIGCFLLNLITGCPILDTVFGSLITLVSALLTFLIGKTVKNLKLKLFLGGLFPLLLNAFLLPLIWHFCYYNQSGIYFINSLYLLASQSLSIYLLGVPLILILHKYKVFENIKNSYK